jgi:hypothetical protein
MKQTRIDKILETIDEALVPALDVGNQTAGDTSYTADGWAEMPGAGALCVRCDYSPAGPSGWCDRCKPDRPEPERSDPTARLLELARRQTEAGAVAQMREGYWDFGAGSVSPAPGCACPQCAAARGVPYQDPPPEATERYVIPPGSPFTPVVRPGRVVTVEQMPDGSMVMTDAPDRSFRSAAQRMEREAEAFVFDSADPAAAAFRSMGPVTNFEFAPLGWGLTARLFPNALRMAQEAEEAADRERARRELEITSRISEGLLDGAGIDAATRERIANLSDFSLTLTGRFSDDFEPLLRSIFGPPMSVLVEEEDQREALRRSRPDRIRRWREMEAAGEAAARGDA